MSFHLRQAVTHWRKSISNLLALFIYSTYDRIVSPLRDRLTYLIVLLSGRRKPNELSLLSVPRNADRRVLVGPFNFAGQGYLWARAVETNSSNAVAVNFTMTDGKGFGFKSDMELSRVVHRSSPRWRSIFYSWIESEFTHILVEGGAGVFDHKGIGARMDEFRALRQAGKSVAFVCHGSDIRSPEKHRRTTNFSPYGGSVAQDRRQQSRVDRTRAFLESTGAPVFVSTPDLLNDYPNGIWLPVVVDFEYWSGLRGLASESRIRPTPIVLHAPSRAAIKGTDLILPHAEALAADNRILYRQVSGVTNEEAAQMIAKADIVLDQFRLGSYGVAACESMAAGKVVIGHVTEQVRRHVASFSGMDLPIVEATADSLSDVLSHLLRNPELMRDIAARGPEFVRRVHSGASSAAILEEHWLRSFGVD